MNQLDAKFGEYGGMYVPELLIPALDQLEQAFLEAKDDPAFNAEFMSLLKDYAGRPTSMTLTRNLVSNPKVKLYLKREDLLHGGAHKTNTLLMFAQTTNTMVRGPDGEKFREQLAEEVKALGKDIRIRSALQDNELQRERRTSAGAQNVPPRPALDTLVQRMRREKSWRDMTRNQPEPGQSYADTVRKGVRIGSPRSPSN